MSKDEQIELERLRHVRSSRLCRQKVKKQKVEAEIKKEQEAIEEKSKPSLMRRVIELQKILEDMKEREK